MALAPLAHVLFTRVMRYDAAEPDWADRDRFVLSNGHASILQYSMLHLMRLRPDPRRPPGVPPVGFAHAGPPRGAPHRGRRGHHRPARPGLRQRRRAWDSPSGPCAPASALTSSTTTPIVICGDGDLEEGVSHEAASLAGHLGLGTPRLRLRRQPHLHRRPDRAGALRRPGRPIRAPTAGTFEDIGEVANDLDALERAARHRPATRRRGAVAHRAAQPHRLPLPQVHRHRPRPTATRSAPTRSRPPRSVMGLPADETFWVPDDVLELYREAGARGARDPRGLGAATRRRWSGDRAALATPRWASHRARAGWEAKLPTCEAGDVDRHPQGRQAGARRARRGRPRPRRRRRRPDRQHRRRSSPGATPSSADDARRPPGPLRHPRARHGRGDERHGAARRDAALRRDVLRVQRLHAPRGPPRRAQPGQGRLLVDPRLGRPGRGRPHPPAGRAARLAAGHARALADPSGRRQRDRRGLAASRVERRRARPRWC